MTDFTPSQLNRMDTQRLAAYRTNLDFYNGSQWQQTSRHRQLVFNYVKVSIDKVTSFLMPGLGFAYYPGGTPLSLRGAQRRSKLESEEDRARRAEQFLRQVYEQNNLQQLDYETEVDTAILGDGCYKVIWDTDEKRIRITAPDVSGIYAWWLERPDGVWRAPRPADSPLDLTTDIVSLTLTQSTQQTQRTQRTLVIEINNSKGQYANPGQGSLANLKKRSEIVLELGYMTTAGSETSEAGTYWIDSWEYSSKPNVSRFILTCLDGWGLMDRWTARYQMRWNKDEVNPKSVWQILYQLLARAGIKLTNTPAKPQSSPINNFYPDFTANPGTWGDSAIRKLLSFVPDKLVFRGQEAFTKNPLAGEESCYSYGTDHAILAGQYTQAVTLSRSRALGRDDSNNRILEEAQDWDLLALAIDILEQDYDPNLQTAARTQERADAILRTRAQEANPAAITVPTNVGQELLDVVEVTDERCGISEESYRVRAIQTDYDRRKGRYEQMLTLGAL